MTNIHWRCIIFLGLKLKEVNVSIIVSTKEINHICQQYGPNAEGSILINLLEGKLKEMETLGNGFVGCFLLFLLGTLSCPIMSYNKIICQMVISILRNIDEIRNLNWAKFVLDFLIQDGHKYKNKNHVGVNGCMLFLMVICSK